ncbi:putative hemolysin [Vigna unguiculata]|uniref:Putative hemolysin n=1 Tax=Vigna unguiculata TaxID=3917 RepID=A0A4D6MAG8_VIGUN|nr:putative hemolysin [Vigna unguiculata]
MGLVVIIINTCILATNELDRSWKELGVDITSKVALHSELSTGGFTGCLLHYGASHVCGVDVGYGLVTFQRYQRMTAAAFSLSEYVRVYYCEVDRLTHRMNSNC